MKEVKLLECPFCGCPANQPVNETPWKRPTWEISCTQYCFSMRRDTKKAVIESWNRRVKPTENND